MADDRVELFDLLNPQSVGGTNKGEFHKPQFRSDGDRNGYTSPLNAFLPVERDELGFPFALCLCSPGLGPGVLRAPNASDRSRHGTPVRRHLTAPSMKIRSSFAGLSRLRTDNHMPTNLAHCWSLKSV